MEKDFDIKNIKVIQAPLAGISDIVYRNLIRRYGSKCLLSTEMLSSEALKNVPNPKIADFKEEEYPLSFQIVGHKPDLMVKAAKILEPRASVIDINCGCPVNKVVKSNDQWWFYLNLMHRLRLRFFRRGYSFPHFQTAVFCPDNQS